MVTKKFKFDKNKDQPKPKADTKGFIDEKTDKIKKNMGSQKTAKPAPNSGSKPGNKKPFAKGKKY